MTPLLDEGQLEGLSRPRAEIGRATQEQGVYFLFRRKRLIYVGRSRAVGKRLWGHTARRFDAFAVVDEPDRAERFALEKEYQRHFADRLRGRQMLPGERRGYGGRGTGRRQGEWPPMPDELAEEVEECANWLSRVLRRKVPPEEVFRLAVLGREGRLRDDCLAGLEAHLTGAA